MEGNRFADTFAKLGTDQHPFEMAMYADVKNAAALTQITAKFIKRAAIHFVNGMPRLEYTSLWSPLVFFE